MSLSPRVLDVKPSNKQPSNIDRRCQAEQFGMLTPEPAAKQSAVYPVDTRSTPNLMYAGGDEYPVETVRFRQEPRSQRL